MTPQETMARAADLAARAHKGRTRKGDARAPYFNHLAEVALLVAEAGGDPALVAAAYLHDIVEKGGVAREAVAAQFGPDIAGLVTALTDPPELTEAERRSHQAEIAPRLPARAKLLKLADKISNLRDVAAYLPKDWDAPRLAAYLDWADEVAHGLRGESAVLDAAYARARTAARARLETLRGASTPAPRSPGHDRRDGSSPAPP